MSMYRREQVHRIRVCRENIYDFCTGRNRFNPFRSCEQRFSTMPQNPSVFRDHRQCFLVGHIRFSVMLPSSLYTFQNQITPECPSIVTNSLRKVLLPTNHPSSCLWHLTNFRRFATTTLLCALLHYCTIIMIVSGTNFAMVPQCFGRMIVIYRYRCIRCLTNIV